MKIYKNSRLSWVLVFITGLGCLLAAAVIALGFLLKLKMRPKAFRRLAYQIHTQPTVFIAMFLVLTVGHLIVD